MKPLSHRGLLRACHALYWARQYCPTNADHDPELSETVRELVTPWTVKLPAMPVGPFPVTLAAQITMAIVPQQAWRHGSAVVVRGYDETGRAGFMVLAPGRRPSHSRAGTPDQAARQALQSQ